MTMNSTTLLQNITVVTSTNSYAKLYEYLLEYYHNKTIEQFGPIPNNRGVWLKPGDTTTSERLKVILKSGAMAGCIVHTTEGIAVRCALPASAYAQFVSRLQSHVNIKGLEQGQGGWVLIVPYDNLLPTATEALIAWILELP